jgi:hypothetical protein
MKNVLLRESKITGAGRRFEAKTLTFHFCVLRQRVSFEKTIQLHQEQFLAEKWLNDVPAPNFSHQGVTDAAGWRIRSGP